MLNMKHRFSKNYIQTKNSIPKQIRSHQSSIQSKTQHSNSKSLNIYEFKQYQDYKLSSKCKMNEEVIRKVKYNQEISKNVAINIKKRQASDDYLSRYKFHTFTVKSFKKYQASKIKGSDSENPKNRSTEEYNIAQSSGLKHKDHIINQKLDHQLQNKNMQFKQLLTKSAILLRNITKNKKIQLKENNNSINKEMGKIENKSADFFVDLDRIISMDNIKHASKSFKNLNIFQFRLLQYSQPSYLKQNQ